VASPQLVGGAGAALLAVNFWTSGDRGTVSNGAFNGSASDADVAAAHAVIKRYAAAAALVVVLAAIASTGGQASSTVLAIIAALWIVWLIRHFSSPAAAPAAGKANFWPFNQK